MAKKNTNPFDAFANNKGSSVKKTSKIAAEVNDEVQTTVDMVIAHKANIKQLKAEQDDYESIIINHVRPQQDAKAQDGEFSKSFSVQGNEGNLTYTTADRFSVPQDEESLGELKKLLGNKYDKLFKTERTITLKEKVQKDPQFIQKLAKIVTDAGMNLGEAFKITDTVVAKDNLDEKQYELTKEKLDIFRTLVRQNKPSLR